MKYKKILIIFFILIKVILYPLYGELEVIWIQQYNGGNWDEGRGIVVDGTGYIYVTGYKETAAADYDYFTIKYNSSGSTIWTQQDYAANNGIAYNIDIHNPDYVYVTGYKDNGSNNDFFTIKYGSSPDQVGGFKG